MGGSGLIVVVIVVAWALFLVPQLLHRRAEAAAHLADRVPAHPSEHDQDADGEAPEAAAPDPTALADGSTARVDPPVDLSVPTAAGGAGRRHRFGRRELVRSGTSTAAGRGWRDRLRRRLRPAPAARPRPVRSAAARRRRVLALLATATLVTALAVALAGLLGLPVPRGLVALPGSLMVGYLALLALVRPGSAPRAVVAARVVQPSPAAALPPIAAPETTGGFEPLPAAVDAPDAAEPVPASVADEGTWTPVPVPVPTYVTAPRARRSVRTIDLSNPGSWTSVPAEPETAAPASAGLPVTGEHDVEHLRAVGD